MRFTKKLFGQLMGKGLRWVSFDINEVTPHYEPPAGLTTMNVCVVASWRLQLLLEARKIPREAR